MAEEPSATKPGATSPRVAIVGAGIAGLYGARLLTTAGVEVVVLESRNRPGGRLQSTPIEAPSLERGLRLDTGATWFWPNERRIIELIGELAIAVHAQHLEGDALYHAPEGPSRLDGNPLDQPSGRFTDGADSLTSAIADALPPGTVQLGRPVRSIQFGDRICRVSADGQVFEVDHVVLAVPPALAAQRIKFRPELSERLAGLASITPVWMGATTKVVSVYETAFWRGRGLSGSAISHIGPMRELHDMSGPDGSPAAIFGFVPGTGSDRAAPTAEQVTTQMVELFGVEAADPLDVVIKDWRAEEWTSPPGVERLSAYQCFGHQLYRQPAMDGRLHWASTETAHEFPGHIEGALAAAERAVKAILSSQAGTIGS